MHESIDYDDYSLHCVSVGNFCSNSRVFCTGDDSVLCWHQRILTSLPANRSISATCSFDFIGFRFVTYSFDAEYERNQGDNEADASDDHYSIKM